MRTLEYNKPKTAVLYSKHKILEIPDLFKLSVAKFTYSFYSDGLPNHFDNYFAEIASVHKYKTRLASLQKYSLLRMKTSLGQFSLKYTGTKIWSDIPETFKSSPCSFEKQCKNVQLSCQNSCWSSFCMLVRFYNFVLMPLFPPINLCSYSPHPLYIGMLFSHCFCCCRFSYFTWHWFDALLLLLLLGYLWNVFN